MLYITVTPVDAQVDVNDCATLRLDGEDSDLADESCQTVFPSDPCNGRLWPNAPEIQDKDNGPSVATQTPMYASNPVLDIEDAKRILQISAGLTPATYDDLDAFDRNADDQITTLDAIILLRTPYPAVPKGWYTFQENKRRQGRTLDPISRTPMLAWSPLSLSAVQCINPPKDLIPSVVAIPSPDEPDRYPVLYTVVTNGYTSYLYRIEDNGSSSRTARWDFEDPSDPNHAPQRFEASGTPLVLPLGGVPGSESIIVAGWRHYDGTPYTAHIFRIDATTDPITGVTTFTQVWHRQWNGSIKGSPAFYAGPLTYTRVEGGVKQIVNLPPSQSVIITASQTIDPNKQVGVKSYLFALDLDTGDRRWGEVVYPGGEPRLADNSYILGLTVGGLRPLHEPATLSSPSLKGDPTQSGPFQPAAYVNDESCWVNARNLVNGEFLWVHEFEESFVDSSVSLFEDKLYYSQEIADTTFSTAVALKEVPERTSAEDWWGISADVSGINLSAAYDTPAIHAESGTVVFGDDNGNIFAVGTDRDPRYPDRTYPDVRWSAPYTLPSGSPIRCSPLIAGSQNGAATVFVGADNGHVYAFDLSYGGDPVWDSGALNGVIRSSMAAYKGRLYVLSSGKVGSPSPTLYCFR